MLCFLAAGEVDELFIDFFLFDFLLLKRDSFQFGIKKKSIPKKLKKLKTDPSSIQCLHKDNNKGPILPLMTSSKFFSATFSSPTVKLFVKKRKMCFIA